MNLYEQVTSPTNVHWDVEEMFLRHRKTRVVHWKGIKNAGNYLELSQFPLDSLYATLNGFSLYHKLLA